jgi:23S rRNA (uracil1939-C5)-methyltransferase
MKNLLNTEFLALNGIPGVIITDPPRDGMHKDVVQQILDIAPGKIVYVSCNSATQARDLDLMKAYYSVTKFQPVDMFPQTSHVENVVLLEPVNPISTRIE